MNPHFPEIKKNFGFGMMRLPMVGEDVDIPESKKMVDAFLEAGFNYFDTARPYLKGKSEMAVKECISSRYPRERFLLADKLSASMFTSEAEILPYFQYQLETCGVDYFDFYLIHANSAKRHEFYTETRAYDIAQELKAQGKIRHVGMSFHDSAEVLDKILTDRPELEFVQIQFNYADYEDPNVESRKCYEVCRKHGKPMMIMEPVKGGSLINLPQDALDLMNASPASFAIRFCAGFEGVVMVLSGMSNMEQMEDNLSFMTEFKPLSDREHGIVDQVRTYYQAAHKIPCTACRYCVDGCPAGIPIPDIFAFANEKHKKDPNPEGAYTDFEVNGSACLDCGKCEAECPQHLHIRKLLQDIHKEFA